MKTCRGRTLTSASSDDPKCALRPRRAQTAEGCAFTSRWAAQRRTEGLRRDGRRTAPADAPIPTGPEGSDLTRRPSGAPSLRTDAAGAALGYHALDVALDTQRQAMKFVALLKNVALGASAGVAVLTALPIFGAVGTLTGAGALVGSLLGGVAGLVDTVRTQRR